MKAYNELVRDVLRNGAFKPNARTGIGTISVFGRQLHFDLQKEFPIPNSKKTNWKAAYIELLWYLKGTGDISFMQENDVNIWDNWVRPGTSELGPVYGVQWRKWKQYQISGEPETIIQHHKDHTQTLLKANVKIHEIDQVQNLIDKIKTDPSDRRMIVSAWNPAELNEMQLPPCHMTWQCNVVNGKLNLHLLQRSVDVPIGLPFNLTCYAMLAHMIAHVTNLEVGEFVWTGVDVHIYENQIPMMEKMLEREPMENTAKLVINRQVNNIDDFKIGDLTVEDYQSHPFMRIPVAV
jgi:thymidylate synthase